MSLLFFVVITIMIINPQKNFPQDIIIFFTSLQLVPSILKTFFYIGFSTLGLIFVLVISLLFGRVYCSSICPLGTFQDIIIYISRKIKKKKKYEYQKPNYLFHYSFTILLFSGVLLGFTSLLNIFEPYSIYSRTITNLVEPGFILINNIIASLLEKISIYNLFNIPLRNTNALIFFLSSFLLVVIVYLSYYHGRLFCNSFCPAGAILGLISRTSILKIAINTKTCTECGACEKVCKANCIDSETKKINYPACISCFNCLKVCPTDAVIYNKTKYLELKVNLSETPRRNFLKSAMMPVIGMLVTEINQLEKNQVEKSNYFKIKKLPISPPGSQSIKHFSNLCTACHLCVSACPTQVLYPTFFEYGLGGILQPSMNYTASYCNYDCTICCNICPTGAILPQNQENKKLIQIGKAEFYKYDCVVVAKEKECAACSEHCPTKAVYMVPYKGNLKIPELNNDICIGCGACEHACPTTPRKAIYIIPNAVHQKAKKPEIKKQEQIEIPEQFPF